MAKFIYNYFLLKRQVARTMFDSNYISQFTTYFGVWNDRQVPETYSHYSDIVMENLLKHGCQYQKQRSCTIYIII